MLDPSFLIPKACFSKICFSKKVRVDSVTSKNCHKVKNNTLLKDYLERFKFLLLHESDLQTYPMRIDNHGIRAIMV